MNESELVDGLFANDTLFGNETSVFDNLTLMRRDVEDVLLNPHLHPVSELEWWLGAVCIPTLSVLGVIFNLTSMISSVYPYTLPRLLAFVDTLVLLLICWNTLPSALSVSPSVYLLSYIYTVPLEEALFTFSVYCMLVLVSFRFLKMMEHKEYGHWRMVVCSVLLSIVIFIPAVLSTTYQELPTEEIREATNGKIPNFGNSTEAEEIKVVLRRTSLFHDSTFEAMFTLLYRFFVLQVTPVWMLLGLSLTAIKRKSVNHRLRRSTDALPLLMSLLFLVTNLPALAVSVMKIILIQPNIQLIRVAVVCRTVYCASKPIIYKITDKRRLYAAHKATDEFY